MEKVRYRQYAQLLSVYLKPHWVRVVALAIFMFAGIALNLANPQIMRFFIDTALAGGAMKTLVWAAVIYLVLGFARQGVSLASSYFGQDVGWRATNQMRNDLAAHTLDLDMTFHNQHTPGEMVERVDGDTTTLSNLFSQFVVQILGNAIFLVGVLGFVFREDWRIGAALTAFSVVALVIYNLTRNIAVPLYAAEREGFSRLYGFLEERLIGIEDLRTNGATAYTTDRFYEVNNDVYNRVLKTEVMGEFLRSISGALFIMGNAIAMGFGIWLYRNGTFTIGAVYLVFNYTSMLRRPLQDISRQINDLQRATAGMRRIEELYSTVSSVEDGDQSLPDTPLSVEFDHLTFGYSPDDPVLKDVTFELGANRVVGLLGRTGSGKTTITRLLFRLYDPQQGEIRLGDTPIRKLQLDSLRERIALVTQDVQVFRATVRENLALFNPNLPDQRILDTIERLGLTVWFDSLDNGLDTVIAADGLSAGEAQLLAFGRVFLKDPSIVILDEPSSRLDPATEQR
ncbi:MAG: ABC transporter ATP-binding protein, partial [Candidatus Poribacteria bacterium]|nr:ABC transporter ATP-binding protein [Candidatus Poribacteria bacterium]